MLKGYSLTTTKKCIFGSVRWSIIKVWCIDYFLFIDDDNIDDIFLFSLFLIRPYLFHYDYIVCHKQRQVFLQDFFSKMEARKFEAIRRGILRNICAYSWLKCENCYTMMYSPLHKIMLKEKYIRIVLEETKNDRDTNVLMWQTQYEE